MQKKDKSYCVYKKYEYICGLIVNTINNHNLTKKMKELLEKAAVIIAAFEKDAKAQLENGNKAAGTRARKASLELEKLMKEFRKASLEAAKK